MVVISTGPSRFSLECVVFSIPSVGGFRTEGQLGFRYCVSCHYHYKYLVSQEQLLKSQCFLDAIFCYELIESSVRRCRFPKRR